MNMEARSIDSAMLARRCIVTTLSELTLSRYRTIIEKNAGALVVILPYEFKNLSADVLEVCVSSRMNSDVPFCTDFAYRHINTLS